MGKGSPKYQAKKILRSMSRDFKGSGWKVIEDDTKKRYLVVVKEIK